MIISLEHIPVCDGPFTVVTLRKHHKHLAVIGIPADISFDSTLVCLRIAPDNGLIAAFDGVVEELIGQMRHGIFILGHHHKSGGILVNTVYDTCAVGFISGLHGQVADLMLQMPGYRVHQRPVGIPHTGVNSHPESFIDYQNVFVLINDIQGNILSEHLERSHSTPLGKMAVMVFPGLTL
jgi:hypothetical protein